MVLTQPQLAGSLIDQHLNQTAFRRGEAKSYLALEKLLVVFFVVLACQPHSLCKCVFCPCAQRQVSKQVSLCSLELYKKVLAACCAVPLPVSGTCAINRQSSVEAKARGSLEPAQFRETGAHCPFPWSLGEVKGHVTILEQEGGGTIVMVLYAVTYTVACGCSWGTFAPV